MKEAKETRLEGALVSYVLAQEDLDLRLEDLRKFLKVRNIEIDIDTLRKEVYNTKRCLAKKGEYAELEARLFTKEGLVRKYKLGADFCPNCKMYKNYEKECPYCRYLEMTR